MNITRLTPDDAVLEELGARLARVRKQRGDTQEALAERAGIGIATLRRIEDGRDSKLGSWIRLLKALEMTPALETLLPENLRSPMEEARGQTRRGPKDRGARFVWGDERR